MKKVMAMGTERSMLGDLRWGKQRFLRCMKINSVGSQISSQHRFTSDDLNPTSDQHHRNNSVHLPRREKGSVAKILNGSPKLASPLTSDGRQSISGGDDGIAAITEKVMFDIQTAADKMKDAILKDGQVSSDPSQPYAEAAVEGEIHLPSNLRTRRAVGKSPDSTNVIDNKDGADGRVVMIDMPKQNSPMSQMKLGLTAAANKSPTPRPKRDGGKKRQLAKFTVSLSKSEIEEDYLAMLGHRPPRRPRKRARTIQRTVDCLTPGLWLTEVTPDRYGLGS